MRRQRKLYTGLRKGELCGLLKTDVDLPNRALIVARSYDRDTTKGGHVDAIPIAEALVPYLEDAIARSPSVWVTWNAAGDWALNDFRGNPKKQLQFAVKMTSDEPFSVKFALGMATVIFGAPFIASLEADLLRQCLWTTDAAQRARIPLTGLRLFGAQNQQPSFTQILNWRGCHFVMVCEHDNTLLMVANFYGKHSLGVTLGAYGDGWTSAISRGIESGRVWVIAPQLRTFVGPLSFGAFLVARSEENIPHDLNVLAQKLECPA